MSKVISQKWLFDPKLQALLSLLNESGSETRIAGGAVRNALLEQPISDVDLATTLVPRDVMLRCKEAGMKTVPTGVAHGTITVISGEQSFEVTTLRKDVETDGRHAVVNYGTDWKEDAQRRDLTMNALYLDQDGTIFDPLGGIEDIYNQNVRFIGNPEHRIEEDYLRILRFFRFFAWYGKFRPDSEGLKACARLKQGIQKLSSERVWQELIKIFSAPDPSRSVLWMRQTGVLSTVLPESEKWGIDALPFLIEADEEFNREPDGLLRLMSVLPPDAERMSQLADRLKLPNKVRNRLVGWANTTQPFSTLSQKEFGQWLYWQDFKAVSDRVSLAAAKKDKIGKKYVRQLKWLKRWIKPSFPVKGQDLLDAGLMPGPEVAVNLRQMEHTWVESDYKLSKEELLAM